MNLSTSKFTVALIGLGSIAPLHIDALNYVTQAKLVAVCDPLEKTSNVLKYTDYSKLLKEVKPDVVHILTPH